MPGVSVSTDALTKVKTALNDYNIDISGFASRIEQQSTDISKSAGLEMQKVARQIKDTTDKINKIKAETNQLAGAINQMSNDIKSTEQNLVILQNQLAAKHNDANRLKEQITEMQKKAAESDNADAKARIQEQINQLRSKLSQIESEIMRLKNAESELKERIPQLQRKNKEAQNDKAKCEDEHRTTERHLDRLLNKQDRMKAALAKINNNMEIILSASKSFETRAISKTEQSMGNIDKCIAAIDAYLGGYNVLASQSAEALNVQYQTHVNYRANPHDPARLPDMPVTLIQFTDVSEGEYVRVYSNRENEGQRIGGYIMRKEDILGMDATQIQSAASLNYTPLYICDVTIQPGAILRSSTANPLYGGEGGIEQFELLSQQYDINVVSFTNERPLS